MPLPKRWHKNKKPPAGFEVVEPTLEALEHELRDKIKDTNEKKRKTESVWPVHQISWQKSRYIYDMYYTHGRISKQVYNYCIQQKLVDAALIAKWKKPGYERLCSTYVINPTNFKFGTTSLCRVPLKDRSAEQRSAQDPTTGCRGCASGKGAGSRNIFGNKYGQYLAAVQIARDDRLEKLRQQQAAKEAAEEDSDGDDETDDEEKEDDDGDDDGPKPAAGIWASSPKLQAESEQMVIGGNDDDDDGEEETDDDDGEEETDDEEENDDEGPALPPSKRKKQE